MEAWLIYYRDGAQYNKEYVRIYKEAGEKLGVNIRLILIEELEYGVRDDRLFLMYQNKGIEKPAFVIFRAIDPLLARHLELMRIRVFNNSTVSEICNDKARTYQYLAGTGIRMIDTSFYRSFQAKEVLTGAGLGTVVKAVDGHGGSQVFLIDDNTCSNTQVNKKADDVIMNRPNKEEIETNLEGSDFILQPLIGSKHQDLRVYVIGKKIVAAVLRTSREGFRSNYSLGGDVTLYQLNREEKTIVDKVIERFDFGLVGIDFIIGDRNELIFNEIEDVVGARMLYQCSDINIAERYLEYILQCL